MDWLLLLGLVVFVVFSFAYVKRWLYRRDLASDFRIDDRKAWQKKWQELENLLGGDQSSWQVSIIEADKLFDRVLKHMCLPGKDFGERLKYLTRNRTELRFIWSAHLTRNRLVHETNYRLDKKTAVKTLQTFKRGLKELGVL